MPYYYKWVQEDIAQVLFWAQFCTFSKPYSHMEQKGFVGATVESINIKCRLAKI